MKDLSKKLMRFWHNLGKWIFRKKEVPVTLPKSYPMKKLRSRSREGQRESFTKPGYDFKKKKIRRMMAKASRRINRR